MRRLLTILVAPALAACVQMDIDERSVFQPPKVETRATAAAGLRLRDEEKLAPASVRHGFIGEGETRIAWTLVSREGANRPLILHCGGNASDRFRSGVGYASKALPWGDVLMFDYPGYGDSGGAPNAQSFDAMLDPIGAFATAQAQGRPLIFWGHSLGGMVCAGIAGRTPAARGMVFETSARNADEVAAEWKPWWLGPFVRVEAAESLRSFDAVTRLKGLNGPVLVLGAGRDASLPVKLSRSLAEGARKEGLEVNYVEFAEANHVNVSKAEGFDAAMGAFLIRALAPREGRPAP